MQVFQRQLRRSLHMKKIITYAPLCVLLRTVTAVTKADKHIVNSRNSYLPTRIHPMKLKKPQKIFYIKFTQKKVQ